MKNTIVICTLLALMYACSNSKVETLQSKFPAPISLQGTELKLASKFSNPCYLDVVQDSILIVGDPFVEPYYWIFNLNSGDCLRTFGKQGRGRNEFHFGGPLKTVQNPALAIECYEMNSKRIFTFRLDSLLLSPNYYGEQENETAEIIEGMTISYEYFAGGKLFAGVFNQGALVYLNPSQKPVYFADFPVAEQHKSLSHFQKGTGYQSQLATDRSGNRFVRLISPGILEVYRMKNEKIEKETELVLAFPEFSEIPQDSIQPVIFDKKSEIGISNIAAADDLIFVIHSDKSYEKDRQDAGLCDKVYVFDWKLNPVKCFSLDIPILNISIYNNVLYGINNSSEPVIVKFPI